MGDELDGVGVVRFQREPGDDRRVQTGVPVRLGLSGPLGEPLGEECGLPEAGGRCDEDQPRRELAGGDEPGLQACSLDERPSGLGHPEPDAHG